MKCPVCSDVRMREIEKDGVLIDVCPDCKGVWLDRGELDKLVRGVKEVRDDYDRLERSVQVNPAYPPNESHFEQDRDRHRSQGQDHNYNTGKGYSQNGYDSHGYDKHGYDKYGKPRKKKTMLDVFGDLFE
ncbi:zf-TFIIB domain-containing protein [Paenibacillus sp. CF384]|uniref:TFIIB-type zinc ribbon-containing protein n=1 Tax=Paenibacillus sp. CF384 TaxID=1884382 RepID=UPI0008947FF4|nr:zf-TFIIB domain-containing protein [Paenibacillus sp. CF384]SDW56028.1 hypothetical protein SAMN05518855_100389 [Paenibacillus sp. CF384]